MITGLGYKQHPSRGVLADRMGESMFTLEDSLMRGEVGGFLNSQFGGADLRGKERGPELRLGGYHDCSTSKWRAL
jgi:hypothetical protein